MILTKKIKIKITPFNIEYYKNLGYSNIIFNKKIIVPINHLSIKSNIRICVKCDVCEKEKNIKYCDYLKNFNNGNFYCCCSKCSRIKVKQTNLKRYGIEHTFQSKEFREKGRKTCLEKYGVENPRQNEKVKEMAKNTCLKKYGVDNPMKSKIIKEKTEKTCLKKYGDKYIMRTQNFKDSSKASLLKKYGVENVMQNENIHQKQQISGYF